MSQENVDIVVEQFAATNERDFERAMELYAEDVVLVVHADAFLERGRFEGRDAVGRWFGNWFSTFEPGYRLEITEARDFGDLVYLDATHHGRGRASGLEVVGRTGYVYGVRADRIVSAELFATPEEALEAAARIGKQDPAGR